MPSKIFPRSLPKMALFAIACGMICGLAFFVFSSARLAYSSPFADGFLLLYSAGCAIFGTMTATWASMAVINRKNKKVMAFTGSVAILLAAVPFSFFIKQIL